MKTVCQHKYFSMGAQKKAVCRHVVTQTACVYSMCVIMLHTLIVKTVCLCLTESHTQTMSYRSKPKKALRISVALDRRLCVCTCVYSLPFLALCVSPSLINGCFSPLVQRSGVRGVNGERSGSSISDGGVSGFTVLHS